MGTRGETERFKGKRVSPKHWDPHMGWGSLKENAMAIVKLKKAELEASLLAGNAIVTFHNSRNGNHFTYEIKKAPQLKELFFVSVLHGPDNTNDYRYLGIIADGIYRHGKKSKISCSAPNAKAFEWVWENLHRLPPALEIYHRGFCLRCARLLTVPSSIESGFGPECIKLVYKGTQNGTHP